MADSDIFLARTDEVRRFTEALEETRRAGGLELWPTVVLVYGLGGIGKSTMLHRFRELAGERDAAVWIDFEEERKLQPAYGAELGPGLQPVLDSIMRGCLEAMEDHGDRSTAARAFDRYRESVVKLPRLLDQARAAVADAQRSGVTKEEIAAVEKSVLAIGTLMAGQPLSVPIGVGAAAAIGQATVARPGIWRRLTGAPTVKPEDYDLLTDSHRSLARMFGEAIAEVSGLRPLVILLDTSEIVLSQLPWIRLAMQASGDRVLWVVGIRLEQESSAGQDSEMTAFVRQVPQDRLRLMGLARFDDQTVATYLERRLPDRGFDEQEISQIAGFTRGLPLAVSLVADLMGAGASIEQACADVRRPPSALEPVTASQVVTTLARRFLIHAERQPGHREKQELHRILCLAVANGGPARNPEVLRALWGTVDDLSDALDELAARHDFVLSGSFRLHDDVRDALRNDLLDPIRRVRLRGACQQAADVCAESLARQRLLLPDLRDQLASDSYQALLLDYVWYQFWADPAKGWQVAMAFLPVLAVGSAHAASALLTQVSWFAERGSQDEMTLLSEMAQVRPPSFREQIEERVAQLQGRSAARPVRLAHRVTSSGIRRLERVQPIPGLLGSERDRETAMEVMRAQLLVAEKAEPAALAAASNRLVVLAQAGDCMLGEAVASTLMSIAELSITVPADEPLPSAAQLRTAGSAAIAAETLSPQAPWALGSVAMALEESGYHEFVEPADRLYRDALHEYNEGGFLLVRYAMFLEDVRKDYDVAEKFYRRAVDATPQYGFALVRLGMFLAAVRRDHGAAEAAYRRAVEVAPQYGFALVRLGMFLEDVREDPDEAEGFYRRAVEADPGNAFSLGRLAQLLDRRGDCDAAEVFYRRAVEVEPKDSFSLGRMAMFLAEVRDDYDAAEVYFRRAVEADPTNSFSLVDYAFFMLAVHEDYDAAEDLMRRGLAARPNGVYPLAMYAHFLTDVRQDFNAADELYQRALHVNPSDPDILGSYARLKFIIGDDREGQRLALDALRLASDHADSIRARCNFLLFAHCPRWRTQAGVALKELLSRQVSIDWRDLAPSLGREREAVSPRVPLLEAVAESLGRGETCDLETFSEWSALPPPT